MNGFSLRLVAKNIPLLRALSYKECPYHVGSIIENRLGLQIGRTIGKRLAWCLRKSYISSEIQEYVDVMNRDGILVIPNFLSADQFLQVQNEFDRAEPRFAFQRFRGGSAGQLEVTRFHVSDDNKDSPYTKRYLQDNPLILSITAAVIRRRIKSKSVLMLNVYRKRTDSVIDNDLENILHADLHTPTLKAFYYVNDIDSGNGAFVYAKGSHKLSMSRLGHEYDMSVRSAKLKKGDHLPADLLEYRGPLKRNKISESYRSKMKIVETQICGKPNTLVIANNMGFHRRGEFTSERPRKTILLNFRHLEEAF